MTREAFDFIHEECQLDEEYEEGREREGIVGECDNCGRSVYDFEKALAVVSGDGKDANLYCQYCTAKNLRFVEDILNAAGLWYMYGWADEAIDNAQAEIYERKKASRKKASAPAKKHLIIRTAAEMYGQRAF